MPDVVSERLPGRHGCEVIFFHCSLLGRLLLPLEVATAADGLAMIAWRHPEAALDHLDGPLTLEDRLSTTVLLMFQHVTTKTRQAQLCSASNEG